MAVTCRFVDIQNATGQFNNWSEAILVFWQEVARQDRETEMAEEKERQRRMVVTAVTAPTPTAPKTSSPEQGKEPAALPESQPVRGETDPRLTRKGRLKGGVLARFIARCNPRYDKLEKEMDKYSKELGVK